MVCFQTKNPILDKFWRILQWKILEYLIINWSNLRPLAIFYVHLAFLWSFGIFLSVLVFCTRKNLAALNCYPP
jgi:hypothetical protein